MIYLMHVCAAQVVARRRRAGGLPTLSGPGGRTGWARWRSASTARAATSGRRSARSGRTARLVAAEVVGDQRRARGQLRRLHAARRDGVADRVEPLLRARGRPGIETAGPWVGLGLRGNASAPMTFDVAVADATLLGEDGKGLDLMLGVVLPWFQLGRAPCRSASPRRALGAAVAHVTGAKLEHLGQTLADLPNVRARLGRSQTEVDASPAFLADLARRMATGDATAPCCRQGGRGRDGDAGHDRGDAGVRRRRVEPGAARSSGSSATRAPAP